MLPDSVQYFHFGKAGSVPNAVKEYVDAKSRRQKGTVTEPNPIYDPKQFGRLMEESQRRGGAHHLATLIALDTGMRPAEIRGLRWEDWTSKGERPNLHVVRSVDAGGVVEKPNAPAGSAPSSPLQASPEGSHGVADGRG
jgi:hypothetical protein